jgi:hypothetical protein
MEGLKRKSWRGRVEKEGMERRGLKGSFQRKGLRGKV